MFGVTTRTSPKSMMQLQFVVDQKADVTSFRTGKEAVYLFSKPTFPRAFVAQKVTEHPPTRIRDTFSQMVIFEHPANVQVLNFNVAKLIDDLAAFLVKEILPLVGNLFVLASHLQAGLILTIATFLTPAQLALESLKSAFRLSEVLRVVNLFAGAENCECFKPQINADRARFLDGVLAFDLTLNRDKVFTAWGLGDGTIFHLPFDRPVKDSAYLADFGQLNPTANHLKPLRIADRLSVELVFECGVLGSALEKVHKGAVKIFKGLLQNLTIGFFQPRYKGLDDCQHIGRVVVIQPFTVFGIVSFAGSQGHIVNETSMAELNRQRRLFGLVGVNSKLKRLFDFQYTS